MVYMSKKIKITGFRLTEEQLAMLDGIQQRLDPPVKSRSDLIRWLIHHLNPLSRQEIMAMLVGTDLIGNVETEPISSGRDLARSTVSGVRRRSRKRTQSTGRKG